MIYSITVPAHEVSISVNEVLRYMGCPREPGDSGVRALAEKCLGKLQADYRACYTIVPVGFADSGVDLGAFIAPGKALAKNLKDCDRAVLFAATIGIEADRQRSRVQALSSAEALALDAAGSAAIEAFCDLLCARWKAQFASEGVRLRPRFSPGYGDLPLEMQKALLEALDSGRKAGITCTESLMMVPWKSVSAIVGLSKEGCAPEVSTCGLCGQEDCRFRPV